MIMNCTGGSLKLSSQVLMQRKVIHFVCCTFSLLTLSEDALDDSVRSLT
jgi:hypothetical protein